MRRIYSEALDETVYRGKLGCGMNVVFAPRKKFKKKIAFIVADYGSIHSRWKENGKNVSVPDGVAHFLEHQMFKKAHADLTDVFSQRGAYCNAHTSHTHTAYYFECTSQFNANLGTLFELVLTPYFDKKLVDTERDIIVQEINQYRDHPGWVGYQMLLESLYAKHPVRIDIAGTAETVGRVTPATLAKCHRAHYHPSNLTLLVSGDLKPEQLLRQAERWADRFATTDPAPRLENPTIKEPRQSKVKVSERGMFLARERLLVGFKDTAAQPGRDMVRRSITSSLAMNCMFANDSDAFESLYRDGLIADDFGAGYEAEKGYGYAVIGGETNNAAALNERIDTIIADCKRDGLDTEVIERKRRKALGQFLRAFNNPESTGYSYLNSVTSGTDLFDYPEVLQSVTTDEVNARVRELLVPSARSASILRPVRS